MNEVSARRYGDQVLNHESYIGKSVKRQFVICRRVLSAKEKNKVDEEKSPFLIK